MSRRLVVFGLSLSSAWGNGHAPTYRGLLRALAARDWQITFFERDVDWYRSNRDLARTEYCDLRLYADWPAAADEAGLAVQAADAALIGSLVPDGPAIIDWLIERERPLLFYDIDTPITLVELNRRRETDYLRADQVPHFATYLSFAGGAALSELEQRWGAPQAEALYCGADTNVYRPVPLDPRFACAIGYLGTYAPDRQPALEALLIEPARQRPAERFMIAGAQYPAMDLPANIDQAVHVYPDDHAAFYCSSRLALNLTRQAMRRYGWSPSTRLFEAAASGACILTDTWPGLDSVLQPDTEVLLASSCADVLRHLDELTPERRAAIGQAARERVLRDHTYARRAEQLEQALERAIRGAPIPERSDMWASAS